MTRSEADATQACDYAKKGSRVTEKPRRAGRKSAGDLVSCMSGSSRVVPRTSASECICRGSHDMAPRNCSS